MVSVILIISSVCEIFADIVTAIARTASIIDGIAFTIKNTGFTIAIAALLITCTT